MFAFSSYQLKHQFQQGLAPLARLLVELRVSANQVTLACFSLCFIYSALLIIWNTEKLLYFLPFVLFIKIALNAVDGMIATLSDSSSKTGEVLNELCDTLADVLLFLALYFVFLQSFLWLILVVLVFVVDYVGVLVWRFEGKRTFAGPFGKSDRAIYLSIVVVLFIIFHRNDFIIFLSACTGILLACITIFNRLSYSR